MHTLHFRTSHNVYHLNFRWGFLVLCLFFFMLMCALGVWQLHRYQFKLNLQNAYQLHQKDAPMDFAQLDKTSSPSLEFRKIKVKGVYLNDETIFLQNQFNGNDVGYQVLTPLQIPGEKKLLLIDRGWVSDKGNPNAAPPIPDVQGTQEVIGNVKLQNRFQFILGKNILRPSVKPILIQKIDLHDVSVVTGKTFFPFYIQLSKQSANGFVRDWIVTTVGPERHMGYAIQWFLMAGVLVIAYLATAIKREKIS